ncbi:MAG: lytic murein transglycosylase B [Gammaproteobacteria bacterium]|nr:lytic murein transglycosylase B [Gammaproteobacteria bacterium]NND53924.1 lytic murein transglycosylase B [Gammaproteobacteria bacterium]
MKRNSLCAKPMLALLLCLSLQPAVALDVTRDDVSAFIDRMVSEHQLDRDYVTAVLARAEVQQSILDAMSRPAERVMPWHEYRQIFITPERINAGVAFYAEHRDRLAQLEQDTGVSQAMILGIIGVESYYGRITGRNNVVDALVTLGFEYPKRAKFFSSELENVFLLADEEQLDIETLQGSYAGAMGPPQFIPSSYRAYAVDGDGDGQRDLLNNWDDILASVANYFAVHKWRAGEPVAAMATLSDNHRVRPQDTLKLQSTVGQLSKAGALFATELGTDAKAGIWRLDGVDGDQHWVGFHNLYVITRYNRSVMYALAAWELGNSVVAEAGAAASSEPAG